MNIFKCRCLSQRFIFIHFTNTKKNRRFSYRGKSGGALRFDRLHLAISIFYVLHFAPTIEDWMGVFFILRFEYSLAHNEHFFSKNSFLGLGEANQTCLPKSMISIFILFDWQIKRLIWQLLWEQTSIEMKQQCSTFFSIHLEVVGVLQQPFGKAKWKANFIRHGAKMANGYLRHQIVGLLNRVSERERKKRHKQTTTQQFDTLLSSIPIRFIG